MPEGSFTAATHLAPGRRLDYQQVVLDVGAPQPAARALYEQGGYTRIPGFTMYRDTPGNRAYGKDL